MSSYVQYVFPQDWIPSEGIPPDAYKKFGLHYAVAICTPAWLLGRAAFVSFHEFATMNNPLTHARLGDSNSRSVEGLRRILPPSSGEEKFKIGEKRRFFGLIKKEIYAMLPNPVDYDARQVGDVPVGLSGKLEEGVKILAKSIPQLEKLASETKRYFDHSKHGPGIRVTVRSLGGTEILNRAFEHLQEVKPRYKIDIWVIDERHPNLKALIAYALKARGGEESKDELVILRINKGGEFPEKEDVVLARGINGILSQHGARGKPDLSTIIRSLIDEYEGIVHYTYKTIDVSLIPTEEKTKFLGITIRRRRGKDTKEAENVVRIVTQALSEMSPSDDKEPYFIFGAWRKDEIEGIETEAKAYIGDNPLFVVPVGSPLKTIDGKNSMRVTIIRFEGGFNKIKAIFNCKDSDEIPEEVLEKAIEENNDVTKGLKMASRFFGLDILDFVRGEI